MLLAVDRPDERRDSEKVSSVCSHDGRPEPCERNEELPEDDAAAATAVVVVVEEPPATDVSSTDARFICLLRARMRSGEGGPSMAGSRSSGEMAWLLLSVVAVLVAVVFVFVSPFTCATDASPASGADGEESPASVVAAGASFFVGLRRGPRCEYRATGEAEAHIFVTAARP